MFCAIYRSVKQQQMYLYVEKKDDFSRVPGELLRYFGQPQWLMLFPLDGRKSLANADLTRVKHALIAEGYYLQMPPATECLSQ